MKKKIKIKMLVYLPIFFMKVTNILKTAHKLGEVTVGFITDQAIASYKKIPFKF